MSKTGYVIAKNRATTDFFTSRSSYDRPMWLKLDECSSYPTAEMAQRAITKLYKHGAYEAHIVSLQELALDSQRKQPVGADLPPAEFDDSQPLNPDQPEEQQDDSAMTADATSDVDSEDDQMVANKQQDVPSDGNESNIDPSLADGSDADPIAPDDGSDDEADQDVSDQISDAIENRPDDTDEIDPRNVRESATSVVKYGDSGDAVNVSKCGDDIVPCLDHESKVTLPASVRKELKDTIDAFNQQMKSSHLKGVSNFDAQVADAFSDLLELLNVGTIESMKNAQLMVASWMNPITSHLPPSVARFVYTGGKAASLKDIFYTKRVRKDI